MRNAKSPQVTGASKVMGRHRARREQWPAHTLLPTLFKYGAHQYKGNWEKLMTHRKKFKDKNKQKVIFGFPVGKHKTVTSWLNSVQCSRSHDTVTVIAKARTYGVKDPPPPSKTDKLIQRYRQMMKRLVPDKQYGGLLFMLVLLLKYPPHKN